MLEIKNDSVYKLSDTLTVKNILGEAFFVLDSKTGKQFNLTEMEYDILMFINQGVSFGEIVSKIADEYDASLCYIERDLKEYFISLLDEGLIIG